MKYRWDDFENDDYEYYDSWGTSKNKQSLGIGAAFGQKRIRFPWPNVLWVKQSLTAIGIATLILTVMAWDNPALIGVQQGLRYLVAEEKSDFTPTLEAFVREGLWLDPYERHVFKEITGQDAKKETTMSIPVSGQFARHYGWIESPVSGKKTFHSGIDIETEVGAPIRAALAGVVIKVEKTVSLGRVIEIDHGNNLTTVYGTLSEILVGKNQMVQQGEIIGKAGSVKNINKGQLHFEVREKNKTIDPLEKITNVKTSI